MAIALSLRRGMDFEAIALSMRLGMPLVAIASSMPCGDCVVDALVVIALW